MELRLTFGAGSSQLPAPSTALSMAANTGSDTPIRSLQRQRRKSVTDSELGKLEGTCAPDPAT
eukprot:scaffold59106_cov73-Phaeocystis_antarctica.AAC.1